MIEGFSAGVEPGGLYAQRDIEVLICYMLRTIGRPVPRSVVLNVIADNGMANYFETSAAIEELEKREHVRELEGDLLELCDSGSEIAQILERTVPLSLRERSVNLGLKMLMRLKNEQDTRVTVEPLERGCLITCATLDSDIPTMAVTLRVTDQMQADLVRDRFLNDPPLLYRCILSILTDEVHKEVNDTKLVIDLT